MQLGYAFREIVLLQETSMGTCQLAVDSVLGKQSKGLLERTSSDSCCGPQVDKKYWMAKRSTAVLL